MVGLEVKLPKKALDHIATRHPEVAAYVREMAEAVQDPDMVIRGLRGELKALKLYATPQLGPKYLVVVYRELRGERVIITAYFTSSPAKVKGEVVWRRPS